MTQITSPATSGQNESQTETVADRIARLGLTEIGEKRMESLTIAHQLVRDDVFAQIGKALRVARAPTIVLPRHHYENLSRGKGWCRNGRGASAQWGEREDNGYRVGPGKWTICGNDGFTREKRVEWDVKHVRVGDATWTVAN